MDLTKIPTFVRDTQGRMLLNGEKDFVKPFELPVDAPNQIVTVNASTRLGPFLLTAQQDGPIEIFYFKVSVTDGNGVSLTDYNIDFLVEAPGKKKQLSNRDVPMIACAGDGARPYILSETIFIPSVQALQVTFNNLDVATRKIEFVAGGIKLYQNAAPTETRSEIKDYALRRERTYCYFQTTDQAIVLTALQTELSQFMTVPDDTDLEVLKLTARADGNFRMRIREMTTDRAITGNKIHSSLLFGGHIPTAMGGNIGGSGGVYPYRLPSSLLIRRSTKIRLDTDDLSGAPNTVKPVFAGRKIMYSS